jgi:hypothetical protein
VRAGAACIAYRRGLFRTSLRIMTVFLALCALLIWTFVLRMICLARIAESALACVMPGNWSETVRTRVRVPALSCRDTYRAACVLRVSCLARIAESALAPYVRWPGTWYRRDSDTRSSCGCVLTCCIPCNTLGNPRIPSHVRQSHSKRRPCFDLNFPFLIFSYCSGRYRPR